MPHRRTLVEKKRELIHDLAYEERERLRLLAEIEARKAQLARLKDLARPRVYTVKTSSPEVLRAVAARAQRAIAEIAPVIAERERQAVEHARKEREIKELLLLDVA
jgi:hypothetical protein